MLAALADVVSSIEEFDREHRELRDDDILYGTRLEESAEGEKRLYLNQDDSQDSYIKIPSDYVHHEENDGIAVTVWVRPNQALHYVRVRPDQMTQEYFLAGEELRNRLSEDMGEGTSCEQLLSEIEEALSTTSYVVRTKVGKICTKRYQANSQPWEQRAPYSET